MKIFLGVDEINKKADKVTYEREISFWNNLYFYLKKRYEKQE